MRAPLHESSRTGKASTCTPKRARTGNGAPVRYTIRLASRRRSGQSVAARSGTPARHAGDRKYTHADGEPLVSEIHSHQGRALATTFGLLIPQQARALERVSQLTGSIALFRASRKASRPVSQRDKKRWPKQQVLIANRRQPRAALSQQTQIDLAARESGRLSQLAITTT